MFILTADGDKVINTNYVETFTTNDASVFHPEGTEPTYVIYADIYQAPPIELCRRIGKEKANAVIQDIFDALQAGKTTFKCVNPVFS